ncbi:polysaccharide deacetylase family protein [Candidatus Woesearchaeota archaeon]|nr:polysaccharide deacetylase family protein [Candidatus Woesearchaeota archaeon]
MVKKTAYLTIDDAPTKGFRKKVDFLLENNIPAIFFCRGKNIKQFEGDLIYSVKKGFVLGNHAYNHKHFSDLTLKECFEEIRKTDELIEEVYKRAGIKRPVKLFRFPYLDKGGHENAEAYEKDWLNYTNHEKKQKIQDYLRENGYSQPKFKVITLKWFNNAKLLDDVDVFITFDQMEYWLGRKNAPYGLSEEKAILNRIDEDFPEEGRSLNYEGTTDIILIHDQEHTTNLFFKIIKKYIEKGIKFILPEFN